MPNILNITWSHGTHSSPGGELSSSKKAKPQKNEYVYDKKADFPYPVGFEWTFLPPHNPEHGQEYVNALCHPYAQIFAKMLADQKIPVQNVHQDGSAIEVNSIIFKEKKVLKEHYLKLLDVADSLFLMPSGHKVASGGNHIHMGPIGTNIAKLFFLDIFFRPYVSWVFNDPDDALTARNLNKDQVQGILCGNLDDHLGDKSYVLYYRNHLKTVEWRGFRQPWTWDELEAQVDFVYAYLRWIMKKGQAAKIIKYAQDNYVHRPGLGLLKYKDEKVKFFDFLSQLNIKKSKFGLYENLVAQNMSLRFKFGKLV